MNKNSKEFEFSDKSLNKNSKEFEFSDKSLNNINPELREISLDIAKSEQRHQHEVETHRESNKWDSCCFTLNKEAVLFFSHYITLIAILITAIIGVFTDTDNRDVWLNILMLIMGMITPSPQLKNNNSNNKN